MVQVVIMQVQFRREQFLSHLNHRLNRNLKLNHSHRLNRNLRLSLKVNECEKAKNGQAGIKSSTRLPHLVFLLSANSHLYPFEQLETHQCGEV
jgi:hypothetical protein